jgi:hypothetical protein
MLGAGTSNVIYFNHTPHRASPFATVEDNTTLPSDNDAIEAVMAEVEWQAGGQQIVGPATTVAVPWDARFVVSAAKLSDGSLLARVTFDEQTETAEFKLGHKSFKVQRPAGKMGMWLRVR